MGAVGKCFEFTVKNSNIILYALKEVKGMGILSWIIFGLIAGAIAKLLMPGKDPGGFIWTIIIGIVGAFIGGLIATQVLGDADFQQGFNLRSFIFAVIGSIVLLLIYRMVKGKSA